MPLGTSSKRFKTRYLAVDTETGGLNPDTDALLEIAAIPLDTQFQQTGEETFHTLVRPFDGAIITDQAIEVNGHKWCFDPSSETYQKAAEEEEAWTNFVNFLYAIIDEPDSHLVHKWVLVGWNPYFDLRFVRNLYDRIAAPHRWPFHYHTVDLHSIVLYLDMKAGRLRDSYRLEHVACDYFAHDMVSLAKHSAMGDIQLMLQVLQAVEKHNIEP